MKKCKECSDVGYWVGKFGVGSFLYPEITKCLECNDKGKHFDKLLNREKSKIEKILKNDMLSLNAKLISERIGGDKEEILDALKAISI